MSNAGTVKHWVGGIFILLGLFFILSGALAQALGYLQMTAFWLWLAYGMGIILLIVGVLLWKWRP